jgi:hypothetical protein
MHAEIKIIRSGMDKFKELSNVRKCRPEVTPVEIVSIPARANRVVETGTPPL